MGKSPHPDLKSDGEPEAPTGVKSKKRRRNGAKNDRKTRDESLPVALDNATKHYTIYDYLVRGYTPDEIAIFTGFTETHVRTLISDSYIDMTERIAAKREIIANMAQDRIEMLWKIGFRKLEQSMQDDQEFDIRMYEALKGVAKMQWDMRPNADDGKGITINNQVFNQTLNTKSPLWHQAMAANQHPDILEQQVQEGEIVLDSRVERLESIINDAIT